MNSEVSAAKGLTTPRSSLALSTRRSAVVPAAAMRGARSPAALVFWAAAAAPVARALAEAERSRARGDDAGAPLAGVVDLLRRVRADRAPFRVQPVAFGILDLDGQERACADVQRHERERDAALLELRQQRVGEMQRGGRRGDRALRAGEPGLIIHAW